MNIKNFYDDHIYPKDSKTTTNEGLLNIDNGITGGSHWTCFYIKDNADSTSHAGSAKKSFYFDSFDGPPDKFLLNQLSKAIKVQKYEIKISKVEYVGHIVYKSSFYQK